MSEDYFTDIKTDLDKFNTYFPADRDDMDIIVLRGHQLIESLLYTFVRKSVANPQHIDSFFISWKPLVSLVRSLKEGDEEEYRWVWTALIKLAKVRNQVAHNFDDTVIDKHVRDFITCVKSFFGQFNKIAGHDDLKKSIFIVYCALSTALALERYPSCTATHLVRDEMKAHSNSIMKEGINTKTIT